jgi:membrane protease YdiL (CAAX protease family)
MKQIIPLTKKERIRGVIYVIFQVFFLPLVIVLVSDQLPTPLSEIAQNMLFFAINFLCVVVIFRRFLWTSFLNVKGRLFRVLRCAAIGFLLYYGANYVVSFLILVFYPDFANVNDSSIMAMVQQYPNLMTFATVFLVPVVEETLYRGLIFGGIYRRSPFLAYVVSTILFSAIHIIGYIRLYDPITLLLCFCQYIPAGIVLGWTYAKSGTIWCPVLIHMTVNQIGMLFMR